MKKVVVGIITRQVSGGPEYLLVSAAKDFGKYTGYYYPPGGHIEEGETEVQALAREIREELGLEAAPIQRLAITPGDVPDQETYWWECRVRGEIKLDPELRDARYFTQAEIEEGNVWPATQKFFQDVIFPPLGRRYN